MTKTKAKIEFGDFQTPFELCVQVCQTLQSLGLNPLTVIEPTCGVGNFVRASHQAFPQARRVIGVEINPEYINAFQASLTARNDSNGIELINDDFFKFDWDGYLTQAQEPVLIIGNPPWVTNSELSSLYSTNLPQKENFKKLEGFAAISGKSNFDVSEWMLIRLVKLLERKRGTVALLCKTSVARQALDYFWKHKVSLQDARMYLFDSKKYFDVSVDACLLVLTLTDGLMDNCSCLVFDSLESSSPMNSIGFIDGGIVSNMEDYKKARHLRAFKTHAYKWRSGIKHDCSKVMELERVGSNEYLNGHGEKVQLEDEFLYPMLKSSDVGNGSIRSPRKFMLVTQRSVGECVEKIRDYPKTWNYLMAHKPLLDARRSSIYKKTPQFSIFGIGEYSFAPWKVAISGFYKKTHFKVIPPYEGKSTVTDDTIYFLPCANSEEAERLVTLLNSDTAQCFLQSLVFMDAKRPITIDLLNKLSIEDLMNGSNPMPRKQRSLYSGYVESEQAAVS